LRIYTGVCPEKKNSHVGIWRGLGPSKNGQVQVVINLLSDSEAMNEKSTCRPK